MIKENYTFFITRGLPEKRTKYKSSNNHLTNENKIKMYDYYECDNCKCEIKIVNKWEKSNGGAVLLPTLLTKKKPIVVALCNKCFNKVLKEFEGG